MSNEQQLQQNVYAPRNEKELADLKKRQTQFSEGVIKLQERFKTVIVPQLQADENGIVPIMVLKNIKPYAPLPTKTDSGAPILKPATNKKKK